MRRPLPSLKALRAFEVAARHLSFKAASNELHVTPAAISQQIKGLEQDLGELLFHRRNRSLSLTDAGRMILPEIHSGFEAFARAMQRLHISKGRHVLKVASAPAFASKWLVTHLERFSSAFPELDIDIYVFAAHELIDYELEQIDIGIRYGRGGYAGLVCEQLLRDALFPVCSPKLAGAGAKFKTPSNLAGQTLLHDGSLDFDATFPDWEAWLTANGVRNFKAIGGPRFNTASDAIAAAIQGAGILLARESLVSGDIASGRLVRLFDINFPIRHGFHVAYRKESQSRPEVRAFRNWLFDELAGNKGSASPA